MTFMVEAVDQAQAVKLVMQVEGSQREDSREAAALQRVPVALQRGVSTLAVQVEPARAGVKQAPPGELAGRQPAVPVAWQRVA